MNWNTDLKGYILGDAVYLTIYLIFNKQFLGQFCYFFKVYIYVYTKRAKSESGNKSRNLSSRYDQKGYESSVEDNKSFDIFIFINKKRKILIKILTNL